jgi:peptidoglycan/LPS O-acetylase OafA/YrhL
MLIALSRVGERETAMDSFLAFAIVGTAIIASMGLAMWMEWYCLRWLMRRMPGQRGAGDRSEAVLNGNEDARFKRIEPELAEEELVATAPAKVARQEISLGI